MYGTVGAVDKEKTSLHVLNVPLTVSNLHDLDQISRGGPFLQKSGSWETIFSMKISVRETKIFRTKIPVTGLSTKLSNVQIHTRGEDEDGNVW